MLLALAGILGPVLTAVLGGGSLLTVLGGLPIATWLTFGSALLTAAPGEVQGLHAILSLLAKLPGPPHEPNLMGDLQSLVAEIAHNVKNSGSPHAATGTVNSWLARNGEAAIEQQMEKDHDA